MKIKTSDSIKGETNLLCEFVLEGTRKISDTARLDSKDTSRAVEQTLKDMNGRLGVLSVIPTPGERHIKRILLAGIGKGEDITADTIRHVSGKIAQKARELKLKDFTVVVPQDTIAKGDTAVAQIIQGCKMALYKFEEFKTEKIERSPDLRVITQAKDAPKMARTAEIIADGAIFTKSIANLPPNQCTPSTLANFAKGIAKKDKTMSCRIISEPELKKKGFGGISAVGQGSKNESKLIVLEYDRGPKNAKPIVVVGKAVTFDTGGISLKPGEKMDEMKFDKCGGCTVLGIMKAVSELRLPISIVGIVPSVENMPSGESYRPGDIIKLYSGKTAEILNTDAEGRLILADAIAYGERHYKPKAIIDFATLTGACIIALGNDVAAIVSNDQGLVKKITESSKRTTEPVWELPLNQDYMNMIKSDVADMKNLGVGRAAGTITAAAFLRNAVEETPWAHIDIAGVAWTQSATTQRSYNPKGATGFGVRLILDYIQNMSTK